MIFETLHFGGINPVDFAGLKWLAPTGPHGLVKLLCFHLTYLWLLSLFNVHWPWMRRSFHVVKHRWRSWFCERTPDTLEHSQRIARKKRSAPNFLSLAEFLGCYFYPHYRSQTYKEFLLFYISGQWKEILNNGKVTFEL